MRSLLPPTAGTPAASLRGPPGRLRGAPPLARGRPAVRLLLWQPPQPRDRVPRPVPPWSGIPLFATPPRGRPRGSANGRAPACPEAPAVADRRQLSLAPGRRLRSRTAGLSLFLPL